MVLWGCDWRVSSSKENEGFYLFAFVYLFFLIFVNLPHEICTIQKSETESPVAKRRVACKHELQSFEE